MGKVALILSFFLLLTAGVRAECLNSAAAEYGVSPLLLEAIKQVESGGNPYALNVQVVKGAAEEFGDFLRYLHVPFKKTEKENKVIFSLNCKNRKQAEEVLAVIRDNPAVKTYDVGIMQLNKYWIEKYSLRPEWLLDECYNERWGAYVLSRLVRRYGYTWKAVWHYNGSSRYAGRVIQELKYLCRRKYPDDGYCKEYFLQEGGKRK